MNLAYIEAVERRLDWLRWARSPRGRALIAGSGFESAFPIYDRVLSTGETYYMAPHFCQLVENARQTVPDDIEFEVSWLQSARGWMWLEVPFEVPPVHSNLDVTLAQRQLCAIGWELVPPSTKLHVFPGGTHESGETTTAGVQFTCFKHYTSYDTDDAAYVRALPESQKPRFQPWSYFVIENGQPLGTRVATFEDISDQYEPGSRYIEPQYQAPPESGVRAEGIGARRAHPLHEIRWIYTAFHLMAQRLAIVAKHDAPRAVRRRAEREGDPVPEFIRVVTLRRLALLGSQRPRPDETEDVDWAWQWHVERHWRWQFHPSENRHKRILIEEYVKGPKDRPMKPKQITVFKADR